jgi:hypothetical protein
MKIVESLQKLIDSLHCVHTASKQNEDVVIGSMSGSIVQNRFHIHQRIDNGTFGEVYVVVETTQKSTPLVIKVSKHVTNLTKEQLAIDSINSKNTPKILAKGIFRRFIDSNVEMKDSKVYMFMVMPNYG